jgi:hypothetical protein
MVRARVKSAREATRNEVPDVFFTIAIEEQVTGEAVHAVGTITVTRDATTTTRTPLSAANCAEASNALALVAVMTMDDEPPLVIVEPPPPNDDKNNDDRTVDTSRSLRTNANWSVTANGSVLLTGSVAPRTEPGVLVSLNARSELESSIYDWELGLYVATSRTGTPNFPDVAKYEWVAIGLSVCPIGWPPGPIRLRACAALETGQITRTDLSTFRDVTVEWNAATTGLRWQWAVFPFLELEFGASVVVPVNVSDLEVVSGRSVRNKASVSARGTGGLTLAVDL